MNGSMNQDIPLGFHMALMQNPEAMRCYSNLSDAQKQAVIDGTVSYTHLDVYKRQRLGVRLQF